MTEYRLGLVKVGSSSSLWPQRRKQICKNHKVFLLYGLCSKARRAYTPTSFNTHQIYKDVLSPDVAVLQSYLRGPDQILRVVSVDMEDGRGDLLSDIGAVAGGAAPLTRSCEPDLEKILFIGSRGVLSVPGY